MTVTEELLRSHSEHCYKIGRPALGYLLKQTAWTFRMSRIVIDGQAAEIKRLKAKIAEIQLTPPPG